MEILQNTLLVVRSAIYLWAGIESLFLHSIYNYGYHQFKPTPIIQNLHQFFFFLGIFFIALSFVTLFSHIPLENKGNFLSNNLTVVFAFLASIYLTRFRAESLREANNPLSKEKK